MTNHVTPLRFRTNHSECLNYRLDLLTAQRHFRSGAVRFGGEDTLNGMQTHPRRQSEIDRRGAELKCNEALQYFFFKRNIFILACQKSVVNKGSV
jgi:hypothetical protein